MDQLTDLLAPLRDIAQTGGPVVVILMVVAVLTLAVALYKTWQFRAAAVGRHKALSQAVTAWEQGDKPQAEAALRRSKSYLVPVVRMAMTTPDAGQARLQAEAELRFAKLERGFRLLDSVAQLAPLLGLFGTVLGMIEAFRALQDAGSQVDPSILAGGIWVALLTTAVGLVVAMPTALVLSWLEQRMENERVIADKAILTVLHPGQTPAAPRAEAAHG
ncbi:MotA/TolQ/ExbB proton channel family protein [Sulfitobacter sp. S0837]|uniref:MotA/TolQ/ExbB proton channel family protein n=1 Tax=Sulfitobacter maritimus TaxID=2741719 RepID=UPI001582B9EC|nr:MotA/TolQ/ExbB proton channel family protein [Sulfitobacter maritimus]NUH64991.1 MotA/TolQ/ExbB proton channel family protein [Sulfitobacter maritimus]